MVTEMIDLLTGYSIQSMYGGHVAAAAGLYMRPLSTLAHSTDWHMWTGTDIRAALQHE